MANKGVLAFGIAAGTVVLIAVLLPSKAAKSPDPAGNTSSSEAAARPTRAGSEQLAADSVNATKRKNYVETLNTRLLQGNSDAGARESHQALIIKSPDLERREGRSSFMAGAFSLADQSALCDMGFATITLKGASALDPGTDYAVRCKENQSAAKERENRESEQREAFATEFDSGLRTSPGTQSLHVHAFKTEFVIEIGDVDAKAFASQLPSVIAAREQQHACDLGFTASRVVSTRKPRGIVVPFRCS